MKFGKSSSKCSCQITAGGGFVKAILLLMIPVALVLHILVIVYPINAWLKPFDELVPIYPEVNQTREVGFSFRSPPIILPTYNISKFHSSNFQLFDSTAKNENFYQIVPFLVQAKFSLLGAFAFCSFMLVITLYVVLYEKKKSSITMAVFNVTVMAANVLLLMSGLGFGYDIFSTLFHFHFQSHNYQRKVS